MPPVDLSKVLFDSIGAMTGGLITDITTLLLALLALSFLLMGADILLTCVVGWADNRFSPDYARQRKMNEPIVGPVGNSEDMAYNSYKNRRDQAKKFRDTYSSETDFVGPSPAPAKRGLLSGGDE